MQQKKSARKLVKVVKNLYFCNKFYALLSVNISMTTSSSYLWSDYLHSIILRITQMNAELHVSLSNGHAIGKGSSNYRKFNENSIILDTSFCKGVSPLYTPKQTEQKWFLMRASYGQEQKACDYLQEKGIEAFCPKWKQERTYGNKKVIVEVSMIPNTLFVHSTENEMRCYIGKSPLTFIRNFTVEKILENLDLPTCPDCDCCPINNVCTTNSMLKIHNSMQKEMRQNKIDQMYFSKFTK